MKKNMPFICLYLGYADSFSLLTDAQVGRLVRAMLAYAATGEAPNLKKPEQLLWVSIRQQLDRDQAKYADRCETNRRNGAKGGKTKSERMRLQEEDVANAGDGYQSLALAPKEKEKENKKENNNKNNNENTNENDKENEKEMEKGNGKETAGDVLSPDEAQPSARKRSGIRPMEDEEKFSYADFQSRREHWCSAIANYH